MVNKSMYGTKLAPLFMIILTFLVGFTPSNADQPVGLASSTTNQSEYLIVGAQNLAYSIAKELIAQNTPLTLFTPELKDAKDLSSSPLVDIKLGNPEKDLNALAKAAQGKKYIFFCPTFNLKKWPKSMESSLINTISVATGNKSTIVFPSKVFSVGMDKTRSIDNITISETSDHLPCSKMGYTCKKLEQMLTQAAQFGKCKAIILRHSHIFGPNIIDGLMDQLFRDALKNSPLVWIHQTKNVGYQVAYAPNVAHVMVALAQINSPEPYILLHYGGDLVDPVETLLKKISLAAGIPNDKFKLKVYSETEVNLGSFFGQHEAKVCSDIFYIFKQTIALSDARLRVILPQLNPIPLDDAIAQTCKWFRTHRA